MAQHDHKVHLYKRIKHKNGVKDTFRCMLPGCSHYITEDHIKNKLCVCYKCQTVFQLTAKLLSDRVRFKCSDCRANVPMSQRTHKLIARVTTDNDTGMVTNITQEPVLVDNKKVNQDVISELLDSVFEGLKL